MNFAFHWKRLLISTAIIALMGLGGVQNTSARLSILLPEVTLQPTRASTSTANPTLTPSVSIDLDVISTEWAKLTALFSCVNGNEQIVTTPSGLQYEDLLICHGTEAVAGKTISVHYVGEFKNGQKFDSSFDRNKPFEFVLGSGQVIAGWEEGIKGMRVGSKRRLIIPPQLGYGERGAPPIVPPNATLIFTVLIIDVR